MEVALRRRLDGVEHVAISQSQQTTEVTFAAGAHAFSPSEFRNAVAEADVEVVSLELAACGTVEERNGQHWLSIAGGGFLLRNAPPARGIACVTGQLDDRVEPFELAVTAAPARLGQ